MLNIPAKTMLEAGIKVEENAIPIGRKCNVNGYVHPRLIKTASGKLRPSINIVPHEFRLYEVGYEPTEDLCLVMLSAWMGSPVWHDDLITLLNLRTKYAAK